MAFKQQQRVAGTYVRTFIVKGMVAINKVCLQKALGH